MDPFMILKYSRKTDGSSVVTQKNFIIGDSCYQGIEKINFNTCSF